MAMDSFKKQIRSLAGDFDHMIILALTVSLFLPFYFSMAVIAFVAIVVMVRHDKRAKAFRSPYTRFLLAFLLVPFFVSATYHNIMGMSYSILLLALVICGFYLRSVMTRFMFNEAMDLCCVGSAVSAVVALVQKFIVYGAVPTYRPMSVFSNANYYGMMIEFCVLIALYRMITNREGRTWYTIVILLNLIGLSACASMSSIVALACGVITLLVLKGKYRYGILFMGLLGVFAVVCLSFPELFSRGDLDSSMGHRMEIWHAAIRGIKEYPLLGRGPRAYEMLSMEVGSFHTIHAHNLLLDMLLNYGFIGSAAIGFYVVTQIRVLVMRFKSSICNNMNVLMAAAFISVLAHGVTDVTILWVQTGMLFMLLFSSTGIGSEYLEQKLYAEGRARLAASGNASAVYLKT